MVKYKIFILGNDVNQRLFVMVGRLNDELQSYVFLKSCEIPIPRLQDDNIKNNFLEIQLTLIDFGTDRIQVFINIKGAFEKPFPLNYPKLFVPLFEDFQICVGGVCDSPLNGEIVMKKFCIEVLKRESLVHKPKQDSSEKSCTCLIF